MRTLVWILLGFTTAYAGQGAEPSSVVLGAEKAELARSMEQLKKQEVPPYFLSYEIVETHAVAVIGSFGALTHSGENKHRLLRVNLRVGEYTLDNTRQVRAGQGSLADRFSQIAIPIEDDPAAIRSVLWYQTDRRYKQAVEELATVRTVSQVNVEREGKSADFSAAPAETSVAPIAPFAVNRKAWEDKVRRYTAPFQRFGDLYDATATFSANQDTRWFVSSGIIVRRLSGKTATLAYRIYPDGHEELVRNAEVSELSSASFKSISAVSDERIVYTEAAPFKASPLLSLNLAGAGQPLVSYVVPSMLFAEATIEKPSGESPKPTVIDNPLADKP
jgi:hypothetical protein